MNSKPRRWWISGFLSLLSPGLGQIYNGQARKGIIFLFLGVILIPFLTVQILTVYLTRVPLVIICLLVVVHIGFFIIVLSDAIRHSHRLKHEYQLKKYNKSFLYVGVFLCTILLSTFVPGLGLDAKEIKNNYVEAFKIPSKSMEPTVLDGDCLLVDRRMSARSPNRGDVIVFKYPNDKTKDFLKRVVAVGGDTVEICDKELYVNNQLVKDFQVVHQEPDVIPASLSPRDYFGPITVPAGSFFVMGDNRDRSLDSRFFGLVEKCDIKGTAQVIYWSWDRKTFAVRWKRIGKRVF